MDKEVRNKLLKILENNEVDSLFVDCGQGDKFMVTGIDFNENGKSIQLKIDKRSLRWIKMDVLHPIKLSNS